LRAFFFLAAGRVFFFFAVVFFAVVFFFAVFFLAGFRAGFTAFFFFLAVGLRRGGGISASDSAPGTVSTCTPDDSSWDSSSSNGSVLSVCPVFVSRESMMSSKSSSRLILISFCRRPLLPPA
jgi:hypothetical protein